MKTKFVIAAFIVGIISLQSIAQTATPVVRKKQEVQQKRIAQGVKSGDLTPQETVRLEHQQAKIKHDKRVAKADGVVTPAEKAKLHHEQKKASKHIARQKHDVQHQ